MTDFASIAETARKLNFANLRPKDAATLILVDRSGPQPKILMGRRHASHAFLPEQFVFPGGRIERSDRTIPAAAPLNASVEAQLKRGTRTTSTNAAQGYALASIRETFEETGIIVGRKHTLQKTARGPWSEFLATGYLPDPSGLRFIARAITPPRSRRRFDARFFAADASTIAHQMENVVRPEAELTEVVWVTIAYATRLSLPDITEIVLQDLAHRIADGFRFDVPVPFYRMQGRRFTRELI
jgi:8-oxo-dGTP pyrophosphatase MutT (NUDIX family)